MSRLDAIVRALSGPHWWIESENRVRVDRLRDLVNPNLFVNDNVGINAQLRDSAGISIGALIAFAYVPNTDGRWEGDVARTPILTENAEYTLTITALTTAPSPIIQAIWKITRTAKHKPASVA